MADQPLSEHLQALAAGYVLGDLSSEEMAAFQQLLAVHPELNQVVVSLRDTLTMLPQGLPLQHPSFQTKSTLLSRASSSVSLEHPTRPHSLAKPLPVIAVKRGRRSTLALLAAAVVAGLGGWSFWLMAQVHGLQTRLAASERFVELAMTQGSAPAPMLTVSPADALLNQQWSGLSEVVQDHVGSLSQAQGPVDIAAPDPVALSARLAQTERLPALDSDRVKLLGGSRCQFGQAQGIRLTYELPEGQTVSVYKIDLNGNQFPEFLNTHVTLRHHSTHLVFWREEDFLYALAAEMPLTDLQTLAQTLELI